MKTEFRKLTKAVFALVLCFVMLFTVMPATNASAAKMTNKKAQKILKKKIKTFKIVAGQSAFETYRWEYEGFYMGLNEYGYPYFFCDAGIKLVDIEDVKTGEKTTETLSEGASAEFIIVDDVLYWHDLDDKSDWDEAYRRPAQ